jgi:hypothetical protein
VADCVLGLLISFTVLSYLGWFSGRQQKQPELRVSEIRRRMKGLR